MTTSPQLYITSLEDSRKKKSSSRNSMRMAEVLKSAWFSCFEGSAIQRNRELFRHRSSSIHTMIGEDADGWESMKTRVSVRVREWEEPRPSEGTAVDQPQNKYRIQRFSWISCRSKSHGSSADATALYTGIDWFTGNQSQQLRQFTWKFRNLSCKCSNRVCFLLRKHLKLSKISRKESQLEKMSNTCNLTKTYVSLYIYLHITFVCLGYRSWAAIPRVLDDQSESACETRR